jgi:hypothetical protein
MNEIQDSEDSIFVNAGEYSFVGAFPKSIKLKTIALGTCLGLVTVGISGIYSKLGSLAHVISSFNTEKLIVEIIQEYKKYNVDNNQIFFQIYKSKEFDKKLLEELVHTIQKYCSSEQIQTFDMKGTDLLVDFEQKEVFELIMNNSLFCYSKKFNIEKQAALGGFYIKVPNIKKINCSNIKLFFVFKRPNSKLLPLVDPTAFSSRWSSGDITHIKKKIARLAIFPNFSPFHSEKLFLILTVMSNK